LARFRTIHPRADLGGTLVFAAELGLSTALWRTDGTDTGTYALTPDDVQVDEYPEGPRLRAAGGKAFFLARRQASGQELWVTDGTLAGTRELDLVPGTSGSEPYLLTPFGEGIIFTARSSTSSGRQLWKSDGTDAGTAPITDAVQATSALTVHQGLIYFLGTDGFNTQLWRSDGTAAGTVQLPDLVPGRSFEAQSITSLGSRLLFWDAYSGSPTLQGLWATDAEAAGAKRISSVSLQFSFSGPLELGGVVYFVGFDGHAGLLWRTDGTEAGTYPLRDRDGRTIANPAIMTSSTASSTSSPRISAPPSGSRTARRRGPSPCASWSRASAPRSPSPWPDRASSSAPSTPPRAPSSGRSTGTDLLPWPLQAGSKPLLQK